MRGDLNQLEKKYINRYRSNPCLKNLRMCCKWEVVSVPTVHNEIIVYEHASAQVVGDTFPQPRECHKIGLTKENRHTSLGYLPLFEAKELLKMTLQQSHLLATGPY